MNRWEEGTVIAIEFLGGAAFGVWQGSWAAGVWMTALIVLTQHVCTRLLVAVGEKKEAYDYRRR
jgi:hypothetical protein